MILKKVISGGQTGVDRAALDAALNAGIPIGGWCPKGRRTDDGTLARKYPLIETPLSAYAQRTEWNVRDSDGTLILFEGDIFGGTALTLELVRELGRSFFQVDLKRIPECVELIFWMIEKQIHILNVAGPRERHCPGIYTHAFGFLVSVFQDDLLRV